MTEKKDIDFSDMINKATEYISGRKYKNKISYVIIDEFQDISIGRYNLVKEIKKTNFSCRLFCVGDDWQQSVDLQVMILHFLKILVIILVLLNNLKLKQHIIFIIH
ncbi:MAG: UvrD-helicase domain-containing protein [Candidatus Vesicomyosocius endoextente]|uniref:UvrD-helicase domain-containing protein n=1 Tax=Candidatus Vesicomyosocius endoextente TaxID=2738853 RepID=A0A853G916_9GAMM|nr:UvrD-helicase domain-containing protein [Candidatus Vesicomyosocius endoextente]